MLLNQLVKNWPTFIFGICCKPPTNTESETTEQNPNSATTSQSRNNSYKRLVYGPESGLLLAVVVFVNFIFIIVTILMQVHR